MRMQWMHVVLLVLALGLAASASAQTDVGLSLYGAFNQSTTGNNTVQSPSNSAGGLVELRHLSNPIVGFEATYSYNRANQHYSFLVPPAGVVCPASGCTEQSVSANAHELTLDWVPSIPLGNIRPFGVLGLGLLVDAPSGGTNTTGNSTEPVYVYGAGFDWGLVPHLGLRFQYRGNLYKAPRLSTFSSPDAFTRTAEPMIGAYFSF